MICGGGFRAADRKTSFFVPRLPDSDMQSTEFDLFAPLTGYPRKVRERLRAAASDAKANPELAKARKPRTAWQWVKGSAAEKEARKALAI